MSGTEQRERWKLFMDQAKSASKEGLVLVIGDLNLDLEKFEDRQRKRLRTEIPGSLVSEPKHRDSRSKSRLGIGLGTDFKLKGDSESVSEPNL